MAITIGKLKISALALIVFTAAFLIDAAFVVWVITAAAVHEVGHLLAVLLCRERVSELRVEPWGFEMSVTGTLSYGKEIVVAAAGPVASLVLALLLSMAGRLFDMSGLYFASGISFVFGVFNALPVLPLDGGRALQSALSLVFDPFAAERVVCITSCAAVFLLMSAGAVLLFKTQSNFTLLVAGVWLLFSYCKRNGIRLKLYQSKARMMK